MIYDNDSKKAIGLNIRKKRNEKGWTLETLAEKIDKSVQQLSKYENGDTLPPLGVFIKICNALECEAGFFFNEKDYSCGTRIETAIHNATGLTVDSMDAIRRITGTDIHSPDMGHKSQKYRMLFNQLISSEEFTVVMEELLKTQEAEISYKNVFKEVIDEVGYDAFREAAKRYSDGIDYEHDPYAPELNDLQIKAYSMFDSAIGKEMNREGNLKIQRYSLHEAFMELSFLLCPLVKNEKRKLFLL